MRLGRDAMAIYQELVDGHGFTAAYTSVKRFLPRSLAMSMTLTEIDTASKQLRLSGVRATLQTRLLEAQAANLSPVELGQLRAGQYFVRLRGCEAPLHVSRRMAGELRDRFRI